MHSTTPELMRSNVQQEDMPRRVQVSMAPSDKLLQKLKIEAGEILMDKLSGEKLDASTFIVCDLLNAGLLLPAERRLRIRVSELNLQVAKKAVKYSAFDSAAMFASKGVDLLAKGDCYALDLCLGPVRMSISVESPDCHFPDGLVLTSRRKES
jgi:hypothetical protein